MKRATLLFVLFLAILAPAHAGQDEYNLDVHVTSSYLAYKGGAPMQELDVVIDGKKFQLASAWGGYLLALGDYKAKLVKDGHKTSYMSNRIYELLFPDKKTLRFSVIGQSV